MDWFSKASIKTKIITSFAVVLFLASVITILFSNYGNKGFALKSAKNEITEMARMMAETTGFGFDQLNFEYVGKAIEWLKKDARVNFLEIYDTHGERISGFTLDANLKPDIKQITLAEEPFLIGRTLFWHAQIYFHDPATNVSVQNGKVVIGLSLASLDEEVLSNQLNLLLVSFFVLIFGVVIFVYLSDRITKPIIQLAEVANQVSVSRDFSVRAEKLSEDELGTLCDRFNEMLTQIQKQIYDKSIVNEHLEKRVAKRTVDLEKAKELAENANNAKTEFLSRMSHELRTPMNAILGFGQLMELNAEVNGDSNSEYVQQIMRAGGHLLSLIDEVLDLAQIESGEMTLSLEQINVLDMENEILELLKPLAEEFEVGLVGKFQDTEDIWVLADYTTRLKQVLINVVSNGIKYNREKGFVELSLEKKVDNYLRIRVKDTGVGIPEDQVERLFLPFERLDWQNSEVDGAGIGLTISRNLVEQMQGEIGIECSSVEGSVFFIDLPIANEKNSKKKDGPVLKFQRIREAELGNEMPEISAEKAGREYLILYVEDNIANLSLVKDIFSSYPNIKLISAPRAQMGIDLALSQQPDLILMDINMPGMDGTTAMKILRNNESTRKMPIFAVSANALEKDIEKAMEEGFDSYITKPFDVPNFLQAVLAVLSQDESQGVN